MSEVVCDGIDGSDNRLREVQRTLPAAFSKMSIMSTLGIEPPGGCHYPAAGYAEIARVIVRSSSETTTGKFSPPPSRRRLQRAYYASDRGTRSPWSSTKP